MASTPGSSSKPKPTKVPTKDELITAVYEKLSSLEDPRVLLKAANENVQNLSSTVSTLQEQVEHAWDRIKVLENERLREFIWIKNTLTKADVEKKNIKDEMQRRVGDVERDVQKLEAALIAIIKRGLTVIDSQPGVQSKEVELKDMLGSIISSAPDIEVPQIPANSKADEVTETKSVVDESDSTMKASDCFVPECNVDNPPSALSIGIGFTLVPSPESIDMEVPTPSMKDSAPKTNIASPATAPLSKKAQKRAKQRAATAKETEQADKASYQAHTKLEAAPPMVRETPTITTIPMAAKTTPGATVRNEEQTNTTSGSKTTPPGLTSLLASNILPTQTSVSLLNSKIASLEKSYLLHKDLTNKQLLDLRSNLSTVTNECLEVNKGYLSLLNRKQKEDINLNPNTSHNEKEKMSNMSTDEKFMAMCSDLIARLNSRLEILEKNIEREGAATGPDFSRFVNTFCTEGGGLQERKKTAKEANEAIRHATRCIEEKKAKKVLDAIKRNTVANFQMREREMEREIGRGRGMGAGSTMGMGGGGSTRDDADMNEMITVNDEDVKKIIDMARVVGRKWAREMPAGPRSSSSPGGRAAEEPLTTNSASASSTTSSTAKGKGNAATGAGAGTHVTTATSTGTATSKNTNTSTTTGTNKNTTDNKKKNANDTQAKATASSLSPSSSLTPVAAPSTPSTNAKSEHVVNAEKDSTKKDYEEDTAVLTAKLKSLLEMEADEVMKEFF